MTDYLKTYVLYVILFLLGGTTQAGEPLLVVNQAGYLPTAEKFVYAVGPADSFMVHDATDGAIVYRGELTSSAGVDESTGLVINRGDFGPVNITGMYYITATDGSATGKFRIAGYVYSDVFRKALKGFYFQRCGTALEDPAAEVYKHSACHQDDATPHVSLRSDTHIESTGGWHDAGDYGKYMVPAGITVGTLLMAYDYFPDEFARDDIGIPESGNGIPDILDEIRCELEWTITMQRSDGGVYHKLTTQRFTGMVMPEPQDSLRYIYEVASAATADFAALTARAARTLAPFDQAFSERLQQSAIRAWNFLEANPDIVPRGGFHNPAGTNTGEYGDRDDSDERIWAAAELYETTGGKRYHRYFLDHFDDVKPMANNFTWNQVGTLGHLTYLWTSRQAADPEVKATLQSALREQCDAVIEIINRSGFRTAIAPGEFNWGSNSLAMNRAMLLLMGYETFDDSAYYNGALDQLNYILGTNAHEMTFLTGVGERSPMHIHHRQSAADGIVQPVPGLLAGGPNEDRQDRVLMERFTEDTPPALCYADSLDSYASNEIAINWNAPLVFVAGYFSSPK
ncbi:MAG: glycoside hydrolase family 9 protein [Candidatus Marinimicrobia bacterium]|nr:glycoside hydrolase family 9 protein [Candidatus Neomarinimicrobiota bacterium]MCF7829564.1 glycoside hydrolase family 9 protein [Candidatus Neomarinimicrobiota bacterium]MCF7882014.1 glycoside hydrolase family 9 protein [Candidatus Neomarinimicrobiota bacterium]